MRIEKGVSVLAGLTGFGETIAVSLFPSMSLSLYLFISLSLLLAVGSWGCNVWTEQKIPPLAGRRGVNRRMQLWAVAEPTGKRPPTPTRPADESDTPAEPYRLNSGNIIRLVYEKSPLVTAGREEMIAAQHGLEEFKANLSRFEPFIEATGDTSRFPERRDSKGVTGEVVGGVEKETFDGAVFRLEGGMSRHRVEFGDFEDDQEEIEEGSGGLIRARIEVPFVGSRKRQSRVISAAFQESSARKAVLDYLSDYRSYVQSSLNYYHQAVYYLHYARAYENKLEKLNALLQDPRVKPEDRSRIQSSAGDAKVLLDQYRAYYRTYSLMLLEYLGIAPGKEYVLEEPGATPSPYLEPSRSREGKLQMLADAYENNPKFRVLNDAIKDAEVQRSQAILGTYDITAFLEGTQFPFGTEAFDNRVEGWEVMAGLSVRLNDRRVLTATRKKAGAEISRYRAAIEAEQLEVQRQIATQSDKLCSYWDTRAQVHEVIAKSKAEFEERSRVYLTGGPPPLTIDDVLTSLSAFSSANTRLATNHYYSWLAEAALMTATGEVYRVAGLEMEDSDNGLELSVKK